MRNPCTCPLVTSITVLHMIVIGRTVYEAFHHKKSIGMGDKEILWLSLIIINYWSKMLGIIKCLFALEILFIHYKIILNLSWNVYSILQQKTLIDVLIIVRCFEIDVTYYTDNVRTLLNIIFKINFKILFCCSWKNIFF